VHITPKEFEELQKRVRMKLTSVQPTAIPEIKIPKEKMSKTEKEYERIYLSGIPHKFEGITLKMENGHRYTPDFYVCAGNNVLELHEVKGSYQLHSHGRARLAFDQARVEYPAFKFVWATKTKEGWVIK